MSGLMGAMGTSRSHRTWRNGNTMAYHFGPAPLAAIGGLPPVVRIRKVPSWICMYRPTPYPPAASLSES